MDALSKIFADIHLNHTEYIYLKTQGEWSFICQDQNALIVYIVLVGCVYIQIDAHNSLTAHAGEIVVIPSGKAHTGAKAADCCLCDLPQRRSEPAWMAGADAAACGASHCC